MAKLIPHYQTILPDCIIYIDADPNMAMSKIDQRNKQDVQKELHESSESLKMLRNNYEKMLQYVAGTYPNIRIIRVNAYGSNIANDIWSKINS
jgi:thymidylate kinase